MTDLVTPKEARRIARDVREVFSDREDAAGALDSLVAQVEDQERLVTRWIATTEDWIKTNEGNVARAEKAEAQVEALMQAGVWTVEKERRLRDAEAKVEQMRAVVEAAGRSPLGSEARTAYDRYRFDSPSPEFKSYVHGEHGYD